MVLVVVLIISGAGHRLAIRQSPDAPYATARSRMRFLGYAVENYKLFVFVLSAAMAGVAGALYVPQVGIINPSQIEPGKIHRAIVWVAVGSRATLLGR